METLNSVLFPIDGSRHSETAFDWFVEHLYRRGDHVIFVHVHHRLDNVRQLSGHESDEASECNEGDLREILKAAHIKSKPILSKFEAKCTKANIPFKALVKLGAPEKEICRCAAEENVTYVVMGSRGLGVFRRSILGSVSTRVLHKSSVPVMVVPPMDR
ncbi:universal stress protein YxiE isoform X1 [Nematostella vectensis]|uniref:universal stress protein YxiE isoform X1 n=1 Tax=Nematostella vectensis TaxID=45351 RepID=UPI001390234A|nr:universal stress protein YxiE isoform X1 [Nematostella vectensis]XP_032234686.1 universal stress protein YxiE isoform X1 [Nematostella vectensis]